MQPQLLPPQFPPTLAITRPEPIKPTKIGFLINARQQIWAVAQTLSSIRNVFSSTLNPLPDSAHSCSLKLLLSFKTLPSYYPWPLPL